MAGTRKSSGRPCSDGTIDSAAHLDDMNLRGVGLVIVSIPVVSSIQIISGILDRPDLGDDALVIDVGSVKDPILKKTAGSPRSRMFIGCHPMAGSDDSGYGISSESLYHNAPVLITPSADNRIEDIEKVSAFWESLGARVTVVPAHLHDLHVAYTSHMPHVASSLIVRSLMRHLSVCPGAGSIKPFIGRGFLDATRIASGSPVMWSDIMELNRKNISDSLDAMISGLQEFRALMEKGEGSGIGELFREIKEFRDRLK